MCFRPGGEAYVAPSDPLAGSEGRLRGKGKRGERYRSTVNVGSRENINSRNKFLSMALCTGIASIQRCEREHPFQIFKGALNLREIYKLWILRRKIRAFCLFSAVSLSVRPETRQKMVGCPLAP